MTRRYNEAILIEELREAHEPRASLRLIARRATALRPPEPVRATRPGHEAANAWVHDGCHRQHWSWRGLEACVRRTWRARAALAATAELTLAHRITEEP